ncbi:uncharacterized protein BT62DRAFT_486103 [Guyanagaster necrorhizus]|uniref:Uncharacterized protein n=1 Tax=Guyanagaster necrorhizus TaxID=856835 RepID=A0A9P7VHY9_9AGAR|nr:uncharacterized protein BT62DRAFT_486103 [Guyanagaster necrorhizus MCA 3950]KAG7441388.1 hypothetical protein BT62DRAFT_486103 [Guyanagaster necrorhizus MCA 3950]
MFDSLVLVETPIHHPSAEVHHTAMYKAFATVDNRHDIWTSREAAKAWLGKRFPWKVWDLEVLDIYVVSIGLPVFLSLLIVAQNHGLRPLPTAFYPDKTDGVTLSATWVDENAAYSKDGGTSFTALRNLNTLYSVVPVHLVYGAKNDLMCVKTSLVNNVTHSPSRSHGIQDSIIDADQGRTFASITRVPETGHWVSPLGVVLVANRLLIANRCYKRLRKRWRTHCGRFWLLRFHCTSCSWMKLLYLQIVLSD